jgi:hypothetical protein
MATAKRNSIIQKQAELCSNKFNSDAYLKAVSDDAKNMYSSTLQAWNQCNIANGKGLRFEAKPSSSLQGFTVDLSITDSGRPHNFKGLTLEGGNATCTTQLAPRGGASTSGKLVTVDASTYIPLTTSTISINCKREMLDDGMGTNSKAAEATGLHFDTSAGSVVVPLAAIGKVPRVEYDRAVAEVQRVADSKMGEIQQTVTNLTTRTSDVETKVGTIDLSVNTINKTVDKNIPTWRDFEKPLILEFNFKGRDYKNIPVSGLPANARYILANVFVTNAAADHFNLTLGRDLISGSNSQINWVTARGTRPSLMFTNQSVHQATLTYYGDVDGFSSNYGIWYSSQIIPVYGNSSFDFAAEGNGNSGWVYMVIRAFSN